MKGEIERTVRSFEDRTYGGSEDGHTRTHWHVTTDGEFKRQVGVHHSNVNGEHGAVLTPKAARRLARALITAAERVEREQRTIDRQGAGHRLARVRGAVRQQVKRALTGLTPDQLAAVAGSAVPAHRLLHPGRARGTK